jgi:hypothetical protein
VFWMAKDFSRAKEIVAQLKMTPLSASDWNLWTGNTIWSVSLSGMPEDAGVPLRVETLFNGVAWSVVDFSNIEFAPIPDGYFHVPKGDRH